MATQQYNTTDSSIQSLINMMAKSPETYSTLQVFLHREKETYCKQDFEFLMITPTTFGKVKVMDLNVQGNNVNISFLDCACHQLGEVSIGINDVSSNVLFIRWKDIKDMVYSENICNYDSSELLDFDYPEHP